ncbi:MAG TPA: TlpA disulfide reductase family protein [Niabella sp.]|nr:TlpA disulfide reductase family protein [Niabella sp.]
MKQFLVLLTAMLCSYTAFSQETEEDTFVKTGDKAPAFSFEIEKGKKVNISDYKGKLVLINLFATWCPPCRAELPQLQKQIWDKHKTNSRFVLFVFGREEGWDVLTPFKKKFSYTFPILPDENRDVFKKFAAQTIPRNFLIDENGKIIYQSIGYDEAEFKKLVQLIEKILEK